MSDILNGRVALVTGASRGIGYACALGLAKAGAHVIATARTQGGLEELDDEILKATGQNATLVPLDIKDGKGIDQLGAAIFERWGKLDVLVSAAGELGLITPIAHLEPNTWDRAVAVNLTANYRLIRSMDPLLRRADAARAIFLTSGAAAEPRAFWGPYAVTKAALEMLVGTYADEVAHTNVRCALLNPGPMRTRMRAAAFPGEDPDDLAPPDAIVPLVLDLARSDKTPPEGVVSYAAWASSVGSSAS
jgi:NAD(P)-dependent dehydrogenase (short-subunit alcohol dehydrogenase family)